MTDVLQIVDNIKTVLDGLFFRCCGIIEDHHLLDAGFTRKGITVLRENGFISKSNGRWDRGYRKGQLFEPRPILQPAIFNLNLQELLLPFPEARPSAAWTGADNVGAAFSKFTGAAAPSAPIHSHQVEEVVTA